MNWVDYSILAIIAVSVLISLLRGFTREALSLAGWIASFWVAITFSSHLVGVLEPYVDAPSMRIFVSFAILFFLTLLLAALVNYLTVQLIKKTGMGGTDRMLGVFFGIARGGAVVAVLVLLGGLTPMPHDPWWGQSTFLHYFQDIALWLRQYLPDDVAKNIRYG